MTFVMKHKTYVTLTMTCDMNDICLDMHNLYYNMKDIFPEMYDLHRIINDMCYDTHNIFHIMSHIPMRNLNSDPRTLN